MSLRTKAIALILIILIADQTLKIWVKINMPFGKDIPLFGSWGIIHFVENNGMAFGMEWGGKIGKLALSLFRIVAIIGIGWFINRRINHNSHWGLVLALSAIFAGALGNMIDNMFYGMIFSESSFRQSAVMFPSGGGYSSFLYGKVVDMLYFPIFDTNFPNWFPIRAGERFIFFRPVFNIADLAVSCGIISIFLFRNKMFTIIEDITFWHCEVSE
ncbi:MAG: lipoprotein signal peptidase [Bacteroidales bacterium]|nr:lipoprotein signal peptidase [Bacteroidales bacterium]